MSVPTYYDDVLSRHGLDSSLKELPFADDHKNKLASRLESITDNLPKVYKEKGVISVQLDETIVYKKECTSVKVKIIVLCFHKG